MILDDKKLIFVHITKTGGISVEASFCWGGSWDGEKFNLQSPLYPSKNARHLTSTEIRKSCPKKWEDYVTFTIVRNPFDRVLSMYKFMQGFAYYPKAREAANRLTFNEWVLQFPDIMPLEVSTPQDDYLQEDIDHIFHFEEFHKVEEFLQGYGVTNGLHHLNGTTHGHYWKYYNDNSRELVGKFYNKDLVRFGYNFNEGS